MITCLEINKALKSGRKVYARIAGRDGEFQVQRARVGLRDILQVRVEVDGQLCWKNADWSAVRIDG